MNYAKLQAQSPVSCLGSEMEGMEYGITEKMVKLKQFINESIFGFKESWNWFRKNSINICV